MNSATHKIFYNYVGTTQLIFKVITVTGIFYEVKNFDFWEP